MGTPQGSVVSPLLANIYLHYVFDLWVDAWRKKCARGDVVVVRYADDNVLGSSTWRTQTASWRSFGNGWESSGWNYTQTKRAGLSSGGSPSETGNREEKGSPRRSTFWDSRISAGRTGTGAMPEAQNGRASGCGPSCWKSSSNSVRRMHEPVAQTGPMAPVGRPRLLQLPRGTGKHRQSVAHSAIG